MRSGIRFIRVVVAVGLCSVLPTLCYGAAVRVEAAAQAQQASHQEQQASQSVAAVAQEGVGRRMVEAAAIVGLAVAAGACMSSGLPIAFGVGYGVHAVYQLIFRRDVEQSAAVAQARQEQGQEQQANAQASVTIVQGADRQEVRKVVVSMRELRKGLSNFRNGLFGYLDQRFEQVNQGQAVLINGQAVLLNGQERILNRVNYVAHLLEQQQEPGQPQPVVNQTAEGH